MIANAEAQNFTLDLKAPQYHTGIAYLTYYYGKNMNVEDSAAVSNDGTAVFQTKDQPLPGVYSIVFPGKKLSFDLLLDSSSKVSLFVKDTALLMQSTVVSGSKENILFQDYQKFVAEKAPLLEAERKAYFASKTGADSLKHQENYSQINKQLNSYRENVLKEHPESMLAALLRSMKDPEILHRSPKTHQDSLENYRYYKQHYWDDIAFNDARIIRTPFFLPRLERYFRQVSDQNPDSLIREIDYLLLLSRTTPPMYKFLLNWFTDEYYNPKYMGQDKVFVHLFEKYHSKGVSNWLNEKQLKSISDRAYMVMSNLIGDPAAPMKMTDINNKETQLYNLKAAFTVICFWDPTCGHCKHELPILDSIYQKKWKKEGVKIFAVLTDNSVKDQWKKFISEHHLSDWTNVYESDAQKDAVAKSNKPSYRQLYDVIQTPTIYLLDDQKRIIAKKLTIEQLDDVIDARLNKSK